MPTNQSELDQFLIAPVPGPRPFDPHDSVVGDLLRERHNSAGADVILLGIPFDTAILGRRGARYGPTIVRPIIQRATTYAIDLDLDLADYLILADWGDIRCAHTDVKQTHERIEKVVGAIVSNKALPLIIGGDNSTSFATIKSVAGDPTRGLIGVIQFDAHLDLRETIDGEINSGTPYRRLLDLPTPVLQPGNLVQIGLQRWTNSRYYGEYARKVGTCRFSAREVHQRGIGNVLTDAVTEALNGTRGFFISFDLDVIDLPFAPGVSAHAVGGLTSVQAREALLTLAMHPLCLGIDIVETSPPLDVADAASHLAAALALDFCAGRALLHKAQSKGI